MKWRRKPARPVLAVSRAKHKANSQSLSEASNNESTNSAFTEKHHRGVARRAKTEPSISGRAYPTERATRAREAEARLKSACAEELSIGNQQLAAKRKMDENP